MNFESLANELLMDIFAYMTGVELCQTFFDLNSRLNNLLQYKFNFYSISKRTFHFLCQHSLPSITHRIVSLSMSNNDETPDLIEYFLSYEYSFDEFYSLQSLSIDYIQSIDILIEILHQCQSLIYLKKFKLSHFDFSHPQNQIEILMNQIWNLSLISCCFDALYSGRQSFFQIKTISHTMKYLSIENIFCDLNVIYHLFEYTPNLQYLSMNSDYEIENECINKKLISSFSSLKLSFEGAINSLTDLFSYLPNLSLLSIKIFDLCLTGYEWEKIVNEYLPNMKSFRMKMRFSLENFARQNEEIDELLESFRTKFWLEQHRWYVQCDWNPFDALVQCILYTLPYKFDDFFYLDVIQSKSTHPNSNKISTSYNRVKRLRHSICEQLPLTTNTSQELTPKFSNLTELNINIPFNDQFWSCIPSLNQLKSLQVILDDGEDYSQYKLLVERARNLYELDIRSAVDFQKDFFYLENCTIRRLNLLTRSSLRLSYFNTDECLYLAQSNIGQQCEVLLISVCKQNVIPQLIELMSNLRSLTFHSADDQFVFKRNAEDRDQFIEELAKHLSDKCSVLRDPFQTSMIHIWIE